MNRLTYLAEEVTGRDIWASCSSSELEWKSQHNAALIVASSALCCASWWRNALACAIEHTTFISQWNIVLPMWDITLSKWWLWWLLSSVMWCHSLVKGHPLYQCWCTHMQVHFHGVLWADLTWGSYSTLADNTGLLKCDGVPLGE